MFRNRNEAILGADNKAAVARAAGRGPPLRRAAAPPVGIELLFTTCEELRAARRQGGRPRRLRSDFGFVFDHATPIGELIVAAPTYYRLEARFHGAAAHAGIRPEAGRNAIVAAARAIAAMRLGRLDEETTANVGTIEGGTAANVVAERCPRGAGGPQPRRRRGRARWSPRWSTRSTRPPATPSATWRSRSSSCSAATAAAHRRAGARRRGGARGDRDRARLRRHRRRQRRQRADRRRPAGAEHRQRHRAQPPARRDGDRARRSRQCSTWRSGWSSVRPTW